MGWVLNATPRPLYPRERPGTHCIGCWVGPGAGVGGCRKSRLPPGFDPQTVQPVASIYTDWANPAAGLCYTSHCWNVHTYTYSHTCNWNRCIMCHSPFYWWFYHRRQRLAYMKLRFYIPLCWGSKLMNRMTVLTQLWFLISAYIAVGQQSATCFDCHAVIFRVCFCTGM